MHFVAAYPQVTGRFCSSSSPSTSTLTIYSFEEGWYSWMEQGASICAVPYPPILHTATVSCEYGIYFRKYYSCASWTRWPSFNLTVVCSEWHHSNLHLLYHLHVPLRQTLGRSVSPQLCRGIPPCSLLCTQLLCICSTISPTRNLANVLSFRRRVSCCVRLTGTRRLPERWGWVSCPSSISCWYALLWYNHGFMGRS